MGSSSMCQTQGGEIGTVLDGLTELALQGTAGDPVTVECLPKPLTAGAARACCRRSKRPQYSQPAEPTATSASSPTTRIRRPNRCAPCATRGRSSPLAQRSRGGAKRTGTCPTVSITAPAGTALRSAMPGGGDFGTGRGRRREHRQAGTVDRRANGG